MKIFFDTEFLDGDDDINLLSIGMVREDGKKLTTLNYTNVINP
jgi:hypothetical protein